VPISTRAKKIRFKVFTAVLFPANNVFNVNTGRRLINEEAAKRRPEGRPVNRFPSLYRINAGSFFNTLAGRVGFQCRAGVAERKAWGNAGYIGGYLQPGAECLPLLRRALTRPRRCGGSRQQ
jgi:hypothetical protein